MYLASVGTCPRPSQAGGYTLTNAGDVVIGTAYIYQSLGARV